MKIILTHQNADFDAVASMLGAYKLNPSAIPVLPTRQHASVREFLALYRNGLPFVDWSDFHLGSPVEKIILTDTASRPSLSGLAVDTPTVIIDHHTLERDLEAYETWAGAEIGAATTLLVEQIIERSVHLTSLEATLLALGIYADTGMFTYSGTDSRDIRAAGWLLEQGAVLDTIRRFLDAPLNADQQMLFERLFKAAENRRVSGYDITLSSASVDHHIGGVNTVAMRLRDVLDADALFVLVQMPNHIQLVCRSTTDALDVSQIAQHFGGGGHPRAAAAAIYSQDLTTASDDVWSCVHENITPAVRIADLMSYGVQTVAADARINDIINRLRRIGHEGYPVINEDGHVVGLLTLRDADRALEHGLTDTTVRDVMMGGAHTLMPDDPISLLEQTMVTTDWGQIPIVDSGHQLIGIVTRTDLIKHWAQSHPSDGKPPLQIERDTAQAVMSSAHLALIERIAKTAQRDAVPLYMVGGVVRDLLLRRPNDDIDFVIEGDAIAFAQQLQAEFGGRVHPHPPFGTAKWILNEEAATALNLVFADLPEYLDFATARSELYSHPTALPTVYHSGIKLDLRRRDFTINTIAVQLSPQETMWRVCDYYGGLSDLDARLIRALHSLSFVDDPTRILRAVRFSERLEFTIEPRTAELIRTALPMLRRITGERLRNELTLLLREEQAGRGFMKLAALGALKGIHPRFEIKDDLRDVFARLDAPHPDWDHDPNLLKWHLVLASLMPAAAELVALRLLFNQNKARAMRETATLLTEISELRAMQPSEIDLRLSELTGETLLAIWILTDDADVRRILEIYHDEWRHWKPITDGHALRERGLEPGPQYRIILDQLRAAWLDGDVTTKEEEIALLDRLLARGEDDSTG